MQPTYHRLPDKELDEFIAIYEEEFGEEISRKEASEMAFRLLTFYELLARKLPNEHNVLWAQAICHIIRWSISQRNFARQWQT